MRILKNALARMMVALLCALALCACEAKQASAPDAVRAVGMIFVSGSQKLPDDDKIYATFSDHQYLFSLDAAAVYYYQANAEEAYAGDENFTRMTFAAQIDGGAVGAKGSVCCRAGDASGNRIDAYNLYADGQGIYFRSDAVLESFVAANGVSRTYSDYPCEVRFETGTPIDSFTIAQFDESGARVASKSYGISDIADGEKIEIDGNTARIELAECAANGETVKLSSVTRADTSVYICYESGGQILRSKIIRFLWPAN